MSEKVEILKLVESLPESEVPLAKTFLEFLLSKHNISSTEKTGRLVSLQGITQGSAVTEEDLEDVKKIWQ